MPLYEYECQSCGDVSEAFRSMSKREAPWACPKCGGETKPVPSVIAYPGFVQTGAAREQGRTPIHHNRGGRR